MPKEKLVTSLTKRCVTKKNNDNNAQRQVGDKFNERHHTKRCVTKNNNDNNAQRQVGDKFNERTNVVIGNDALPKIILIPIERLEHTTS